MRTDTVPEFAWRDSENNMKNSWHSQPLGQNLNSECSI
jgi:hypothetical protein